MSTCCVTNCNKESKAKGMCMSHYQRNHRHGDPLAGKPQRAAQGSGTLSAGYPMLAHKLLHIAAAEKALGKPLPKGVEVHHVNEDRGDWRNENLVICPDKAYHKLLHMRTAALDACGNANARRCNVCSQFDDVSNMKKHSTRNIFFHAACRNEYERVRVSMKKEKSA